LPYKSDPATGDTALGTTNSVFQELNLSLHVQESVIVVFTKNV